MKLTCPKCHSPISKDHVNIGEGVACCDTCQEYFRIADYLRDDEEARRISKPYYSKVTVDQLLNNHLVTIPPAGWNGTAIFLMVFALIWNGVTWPALLSAGNVKDVFWAFTIVFPYAQAILIIKAG